MDRDLDLTGREPLFAAQPETDAAGLDERLEREIAQRDLDAGRQHGCRSEDHAGDVGQRICEADGAADVRGQLARR